MAFLPFLHLVLLVSYSWDVCVSAEPESLEQSLESLKATVAELNREVATLTQNQKVENRHYEQARTCEDIRLTNPSAQSGYYWIDPDGHGIGEPPIQVYCAPSVGATGVSHDSTLGTISVAQCFEPGCYSRNITYNAPFKQLVALADISAFCIQWIKYDCLGAPLEDEGVQFAWWTDRYGQRQYYWAGNSSSQHTCQCGIDHNCVLPDVNCNCDSGAPEPLSDIGWVTNTTALPITGLYFGHLQFSSSRANYTLGSFECYGRYSSSAVPSSCHDLWRTGELRNGFYTVRGSNGELKLVFCDFTKILNEEGGEQHIGKPAIVTKSVYFHGTSDRELNGPMVVTYNLITTNLGGGLNAASGVFTAPVDGVYSFTFNGNMREYDNTYSACLQLDGRSVACTDHSGGNSPISVSAHAVLDLNRGQQVRAYLNSDTRLYGGLYTQFVGVLLEEHVTVV